jgi:hypothetical protein
MTEILEQLGQGGEHGHLVIVTIDGTRKELRQGRYLVSDLKAKLGVAAELELDEVVNGKLEPLSDTGHVNVKEGDVFVSHVHRGGAS